MELSSPDSRILPHQIKCISPPNLDPRSEQFKKVVGSLVGLAVGDALGASVEFRPYQYLVDHPVKDMQNGGTWGLQSGQWTDDTSMALCLASSLITQHGFNSYDQMVRYKWWYRKGFLSSTGECFDIGNTTRTALEEFCRRQNILKHHFGIMKEEDVDRLTLEQVRSVQNFSEYCGVSQKAGNGPLMRLAPVPLFYFRQPELAVRLAGESAGLTHGDQRAIDACRYFAALIVAAIQGRSKEELLNERFYENHSSWFGSERIHDEVLLVARGSYRKPGGYKEGIRGKNYIINTLEAALWAFWSDENRFEKGVLEAVNLGDDTDTTAAVYGQLAGAYYGISVIPRHWFQRLYANNLIICISEWLFFEGNQSEENKIQGRQQQKQMTPHQQNQASMPASQSYQHQNSHPASHAISPPVNKDRMGYGIPSSQLSSQSTQTSALPQSHPTSKSNRSNIRGQEKKQDPASLPPAGLPSNHPRC